MSIETPLSPLVPPAPSHRIGSRALRANAGSDFPGSVHVSPSTSCAWLDLSFGLLSAHRLLTTTRRVSRTLPDDIRWLVLTVPDADQLTTEVSIVIGLLRREVAARGRTLIVHTPGLPPSAGARAILSVVHCVHPRSEDRGRLDQSRRSAFGAGATAHPQDQDLDGPGGQPRP